MDKTLSDYFSEVMQLRVEGSLCVQRLLELRDAAQDYRQGGATSGDRESSNPMRSKANDLYRAFTYTEMRKIVVEAKVTPRELDCIMDTYMAEMEAFSERLLHELAKPVEKSTQHLVLLYALFDLACAADNLEVAVLQEVRSLRQPNASKQKKK